MQRFIVLAILISLASCKVRHSSQFSAAVGKSDGDGDNIASNTEPYIIWPASDSFENVDWGVTDESVPLKHSCSTADYNIKCRIFSTNGAAITTLTAEYPSVYLSALQIKFDNPPSTLSPSAVVKITPLPSGSEIVIPVTEENGMFQYFPANNEIWCGFTSRDLFSEGVTGFSSVTFEILLADNPITTSALTTAAVSTGALTTATFVPPPPANCVALSTLYNNPQVYQQGWVAIYDCPSVGAAFTTCRRLYDNIWDFDFTNGWVCFDGGLASCNTFSQKKFNNVCTRYYEVKVQLSKGCTTRPVANIIVPLNSASFPSGWATCDTQTAARSVIEDRGVDTVSGSCTTAKPGNKCIRPILF